MVIDYVNADAKLAELNKRSKSTFYWSGWDIIEFRPSPSAYYDRKGSFHKELGWGYEKKHPVNKKGQWVLG